MSAVQQPLRKPEAKPAFRPIAFARPNIVHARAPDGSVRLSSATPLGPYDPSLGRTFRAAVEKEPGRVFLAERAGDGWRTVTYEQARPIVDALAQALIERGLSAERPLM